MTFQALLCNRGSIGKWKHLLSEPGWISSLPFLAKWRQLCCSIPSHAPKSLFWALPIPKVDNADLMVWLAHPVLQVTKPKYLSRSRINPVYIGQGHFFSIGSPSFKVDKTWLYWLNVSFFFFFFLTYTSYSEINQTNEVSGCPKQKKETPDNFVSTCKTWLRCRNAGQTVSRQPNEDIWLMHCHQLIIDLQTVCGLIEKWSRCIKVLYFFVCLLSLFLCGTGLSITDTSAAGV